MSYANALCYPNLVNKGALTLGAWAATMPLSKLLTEQPQDLARTSDATNASTKLLWTGDKIRPMRVFDFENHNISTETMSTYRIRVYEDVGLTELVYDSGVLDVWPQVYTEETDPDGWEGGNLWDLTFTDDDLGDAPARLFHIAPETHWGLCVLWEFFDADNPAGYLQGGRLFIGASFTPNYNMSYSASLCWEDGSEITVADGGSEYKRKKYKRPVVRFAYEFLSEDEGMVQFDMQRQLGITDEVFFIWNQDDTVHAQRRSFLGRCRELSPIEHDFFDNNKSTHAIQGII